ncbi:MAG: gfo/Idh/MocA family oxidoreductase, partial [Mesorhizobium sp.]
MIKVVLVGCGAMSRHWLDAVKQIEGLAIAGLVDLDAERAQARAREYELSNAVIGTS